MASTEAADPLMDHGIMKGAVLRASAAAALTTEVVGAISAMPDAKTLELAMKQRFRVGEK